MSNLQHLIKSGFELTNEKFKLFIIVLCSTIFLINAVDYIFEKLNEQNQFFWLMIVLLIENFLTCGVYGSLKKVLSGIKLTTGMFLSNGLNFFLRFLALKLLFILFASLIAGLLMLVAEATKNLSIPATTGIVILWIVWLAFPVYYFVLSLFAPIVLFSNNTGIIQTIKTGILFSKKNINSIIVLSFTYLSAIALLVYFPEKVYNLSSVFWTFYKGAVVSIFEIGFISCLLLLYEKELNHEGSI